MISNADDRDPARGGSRGLLAAASQPKKGSRVADYVAALHDQRSGDVFLPLRDWPSNRMLLHEVPATPGHRRTH